MAAAGGGPAAGTGDAGAASRGPGGAGDPAQIRRTLGTGQPLLRLACGRPTGATPGAAVATGAAQAASPARSQGGGKGRQNPVRGGGRGAKGRAGAARGRNQAKLSPSERSPASPPLPHLSFQASGERLFASPSPVSPIPGADLDPHAPRLHRRPVSDWAWPARWLLAAAPDHRGDGTERG